MLRTLSVALQAVALVLLAIAAAVLLSKTHRRPTWADLQTQNPVVVISGALERAA